MYGAAGSLAVLLALTSRRLRQLPVSEPMVALLAGVAAGPQFLGLLVVPEEIRDVILLEGARLLLAASVMAAALRSPFADLAAVVRPVGVLLVVVMPLSALIAGLAGLAVGIPLVLTLLVGACLSPTDPVLAASVVSGEDAERDLPSRLRQTLSIESGANDGLALPLVAVALTGVLAGQALAGVAGRLAWEVLAGVVIGAVCGIGAGRAFRRAHAGGDLAEGPRLVFTLLLSVAVLGLARLARTDGVLAVFVAGLAYNRWIDQEVRGAQDAVDEAVNRYLVLPLFLLLGAVLPWAEWRSLGPGLLLFVAVVLLLRRLPVVWALARPLRMAGRDAVFAGWFGPMGISAVFYLAYAAHEGAQDPRLFALGTLAVAASVLAFGVTGSPARRRYAGVAG